MQSQFDSTAMICVIIALGMSLAFLVADRKAITTRLLAAFLVCLGLSIYCNVLFVRPYPPDALPLGSYLAPILTAMTIIFGAEWILRIRRMVPAGNLRTRFGDMQLRIGQAAGLSYGLIGVIFNEWRAEYFIGAYRDFSLFSSARFWLFGGPYLLAIIAILDGTLITLRRRPDHAEAVRLIGIAIASPLIASGLWLPNPQASYASAIGQMIFLIAAVQYHVLQGQRAQFLNRFLSPSVAELVRRQGLDAAMQQEKLEVTAVACDLRGYTAFAESNDSDQAIAMLRRFYDEVGAAAAEFGATIKDYAGDGVLMLLGAPLPMPGHEDKGLALAARIRERCTAAFVELGVPLGIGVGVASGRVSVGVIGRQRLEYVAVGRAINLAARLCQHAGAGEIWLDTDTQRQLSSGSALTQGDALELKGMGDPVPTWQLRAVPA